MANGQVVAWAAISLGPKRAGDKYVAGITIRTRFLSEGVASYAASSWLPAGDPVTVRRR